MGSQILTINYVWLIQGDILGSSVYSIVHPDDCDILKKQFEMTNKDRQVPDQADEEGI